MRLGYFLALVGFATASVADIRPVEPTASLRVSRSQSVVTYLNGDIRLVEHPSGEERVLCSLGIPIFDIWPEDGLTKMEIFDDDSGRAIVIFEIEGCRVSSDG